MTRLILVRHGETEENRKSITQGHLPGKLTDKGIDQARKVATVICKQKIDLIYSSDLTRAIHTAEILQGKCNANLIKDHHLRERNHGIFQGKHKKHLHKAFSMSSSPWHQFRPPQGETFMEMKSRVLYAVRRIAAQNDNKTIVIVTHGGPILAIAAHLSKYSWQRAIELRPDNTGITTLEYESGKLRMLSHNETKHLQ